MSFVTGSVGLGRSLAVFAQLDDEDGEPVDQWHIGFWCDGEWRAELSIDFTPAAIAPWSQQPDSWVVLGDKGQILWIDNATGARTIRNDQVVAASDAEFLAIHPYGTGFAVSQMERNVYWGRERSWQPLGTGLKPRAHREIVGLEAMAVCDKEMYCGGWHGEIWYVKDNVWHQAPSPTNVILAGAAAHPAGEVYLCGRMGLILRGRGDRWSVVDHGQTDEDFWSVAIFQGRTYVASMRAIYELTDARLTPVDDGSMASSYYTLSANDQIMASIGAHAVLVTDGEEWQEIL